MWNYYKFLSCHHTGAESLQGNNVAHLNILLPATREQILKSKKILTTKNEEERITIILKEQGE